VNKNIPFLCVPLNANELLLLPLYRQEQRLYSLCFRYKIGETHAATMSEIISSGVQPYTFEPELDSD